ncbi:hypothetical protein DRO61_11645 [Candidatus Bathyarchaeota archaeon]|nr:MAG: hypothetical protein DRO61_11645 [Candidatus Bathyarchaeota archaeon]
MRDYVFNIICPDWILTGRCNMRCKYCFEKEHPNQDMDEDLLYEWMSHNPMTTAFPLGGEPLLVIDKYNTVIDMIKKNPNISESRKKQTLGKMKTIITNGTLITQNVDKIKKHDLELQISVDGIKEAHDLNRVYANGKGTFDDVMKGIECCVENNINWSLHGAMNKDTIPHFFETSKWFFEILANYKGIEHAVNYLKHNTFQIIFEEEWDDNDVNILIEQFSKVAEWIWNHEELNAVQKKTFFDNFFFKTGGVCGVGTGLLALNDKLDIFPCH